MSEAPDYYFGFEEPPAPERGAELIDTLFKLEELHFQSHQSPELAVIGNGTYEDCSVFRDANTGNRIVISDLPTSRDKFTGASIQITNSADPIEVNTHLGPVRANEIIFGIGSKGETNLYVPIVGISELVAIEEVFHLISPPDVKPEPMSDSDPRDMPLRSPERTEKATGLDIAHIILKDRLAVPGNNAYIALADKMDKVLDKKAEPINVVRMFGAALHRDQSVTFDMKVIEIAAHLDSKKVSDHDRTFFVDLSTPDGFELTAYPTNSDWEESHRSFPFKFRVVREGTLMVVKQHYFNRKPRVESVLPTAETLNFLQSVFDNATIDTTEA